MKSVIVCINKTYFISFSANVLSNEGGKLAILAVRLREVAVFFPSSLVSVDQSRSFPVEPATERKERSAITSVLLLCPLFVVEVVVVWACLVRNLYVSSCDSNSCVNLLSISVNDFYSIVYSVGKYNMHKIRKVL